MRRQFASPQKITSVSEQSAETESPSKRSDNHGQGFCLRTESSQSETDASPAKPTPKLKASKGARWGPGVYQRTNIPIPLICCWALLMCLAATYSIYSSTVMGSTDDYTSYQHSLQQSQPPVMNVKDTLIMYIFSPTDPEYERNLQYFVKHGMSESHPCHYIIVVQSIEGRPSHSLPALPSNAWYEFHDNVCFDYGTIGWLMRYSKVETAKYKYFIMMNSSVRGPFTPAYHKQQAWSRIFTDKLTDEVKLVGSTISCEAAPLQGHSAKGWRQNPHVQSYVLATDQIGLDILQSDGNVFACYENLHDTIYHAELGSSLAVLKAGYNIDSLMLRYQGVDWRDKSNWKCNAGFSPYAESHYDGLSIEPLEAVFVKVKSYLLDLQWTGPSKAVKFDEWQTARDNGQMKDKTLSSNQWAANPDIYRLPKMLSLQAVGSACFDENFYLQKNPDLRDIPYDLLFAHFIYNGQFEGRTFHYRLNCKNDFQGAVWRLANNKMGLVNFSP